MTLLLQKKKSLGKRFLLVFVFHFTAAPTAVNSLGTILQVSRQNFSLLFMLYPVFMPPPPLVNVIEMSKSLLFFILCFWLTFFFLFFFFAAFNYKLVKIIIKSREQSFALSLFSAIATAVVQLHLLNNYSDVL